ncbi:limb region 1 protein-like isoform X2 [Stegodyphus dumicola]|uniref:limb region 1 protein-like isoform X2 n=1 Tax=Stegodyphus dumicola TaxID=202533 RepID=UPI0015AC74F5|nr:limb region 1 protein-like isoform X2 [Stegodyphus dumicola]
MPETFKAYVELNGGGCRRSRNMGIISSPNEGIRGSYEDAVVYRISLWMNTFSLGVSIGAALLLPISIISNEVLLYYPNSYYVQWLNSSLIQGLWNLVFLFSNVSLFILLPFSHFFIESEGFPGSPKGIMPRVYEAVLVFILLAVLIMGLIYIISAIFFDSSHFGTESIFNVPSYYLPFLYSCVSFIGVLMLLLCTPVGFSRLFTVMSDLLVKHETSPIQVHSFLTYQEAMKLTGQSSSSTALSIDDESGNISEPYQHKNFSFMQNVSNIFRRRKDPAYFYYLDSPDYKSGNYEDEIDEMRFSTSGYSSKKSNLRKNCGYPFVMLVLLILTTLSVLMVTQNTLELCFGIKALPIYSQNLSLGISSLSAFGPFGAAVEIILILYLWCASIVGLYSLPVFHHLKPKLHGTSVTQIIGNCAVLLILSSALPVLARSLGITNFDLLGDFGRINWLGSFYIVLFHNIVFAVTTVLCLGTKVTAGVRRELYNRLCSITWNPFLWLLYGLISM